VTAPDVQHWYVIVSGWIDPYLDNFSTLQDPSLERLAGENGRLAKLTSSSFSALADYEEVLSEARRWVHLITGAVHIRQDPGPLEIVNVIEVFDDGTTKKHPPHVRDLRIMLGIPTFTRNPAAAAWNQGVTRQSFEERVVLFARQSDNPYVADVLRFLSLSPDWFGLYKALEVVKFDLNVVEGKRAGDEIIVAREWATTDQLEAFKITADYHRHWRW
jgi:hypothetical protein